MMKLGMQQIQNETCIYFDPRTNETDYVSFTNKDNKGCMSSVGMVGSKQLIHLARGCFSDVSNEVLFVHLPHLKIILVSTIDHNNYKPRNHACIRIHARADQVIIYFTYFRENVLSKNKHQK